MGVLPRLVGCLVVLYSLNSTALDCAKDLSTLTALNGGKIINSKWAETTADDGKPLIIDLSPRDSQLYFIFDKSKEGIWAEGPAEICKDQENLEARISGDKIKLGKSAPMVIRLSMSSGAKFKLKFKDSEHLHVSTFGWSGDFIPKIQEDALKPIEQRDKKETARPANP